MSAGPVLAVGGLSKSYASPVLRGVSLEVAAGELHAVVGENGAGKSTFARIVAGLVAPDAGTMRLEGRPFAPARRADARDAGVGIVVQELNLIPTLSVAESLFLDRLPGRFGIVDRRRLREQARRALGRVGLESLDPSRPVATLGVGQQQLVEIAAALDRRCALLILDEPTAALTPAESERLFAEIARLKSGGTALLFISHRLEEVERMAERTTVLRDGERVATRERGALDRDEMVRLMIGRPLGSLPGREPAAAGETALAAEGLCGPGFDGVCLSVRRGEIVGLAGLMGAGRTELLRGIFGATPASAGTVRVGAGASRRPFRSPREAVRAGLALVPEDRKAQGLLLPFPIRANVTLTRLGDFADRAGRIDEARERAAVEPLTGALSLRARSLEQPVAELSGGNQQKVLIARWLLEDSAVLLVDEPTRGIDVGARAEVHRLLLDLAARGKALVVASSELDELFALCDRILVLAAGRVTTELRRGEWSADRVLRAALGPAAAEGVA